MTYKQRLDDEVDYPFKHKAIEIGQDADKEIADLKSLKAFQRNGIEKLQCMNQELEDQVQDRMSAQVNQAALIASQHKEIARLSRENKQLHTLLGPNKPFFKET